MLGIQCFGSLLLFPHCFCNTRLTHNHSRGLVVGKMRITTDFMASVTAFEDVQSVFRPPMGNNVGFELMQRLPQLQVCYIGPKYKKRKAFLLPYGCLMKVPLCTFSSCTRPRCKLRYVSTQCCISGLISPHFSHWSILWEVYNCLSSERKALNHSADLLVYRGNR